MVYPGSDSRGCRATVTPVPMVRMPSLPTKRKPAVSAAPSIEVHPQRQVEGRVLAARRIIVEPQHDIGHIAAVLPEAQPAGGEHARGPDGAQHEVDAREQVHEQVARDAGAVVAVVAPAEQAHGIEGRFGARPRKRSQSMVAGEASGGIEYCQAPMAELRSNQASTRLSSPMAPPSISSLAFW